MLVIMPICVGITLANSLEAQVPVALRSTGPLLTGLKLMWRAGPFEQRVVAFMIGSTVSASPRRCDPPLSILPGRCGHHLEVRTFVVSWV